MVFGYSWLNKGVGRLFRIPLELANNRKRQTCEKCDYEKCENLFKALIFIKYDVITIDLILFQISVTYKTLRYWI